MRISGVEVGSFQNAIPLGVFTIPVPAKVLLPAEVTRSADLRMQPEEVRPIPSPTVQPIVQKLQSGVTLKVSYANRTEQMTVQFFDKPSRQGADQFFIVNKGTRVISQQVEATHCTNSPTVVIPIRNGILNAELRLEKKNFNDAHFLNASKFKLDICVSNFKVVVKAGSEEEARTVAERLCNTLTKPPSKPNTVIVTLIGDGPPYKRGKPITVRARVMGEGDPTTATVQATFSNGDPAIFLKPAGGNFFEGQWIPTNIPSSARVESDGSVRFNTTVTVTATGCEQSATGTANAEIKVGAIKFKFTGITDIDDIDQRVNNADQPWLRWNWSPGQQKPIHFKGMIVDEEGQLIPSTVSVQFQFFPMGEDSLKAEDQNINAQDGKFVFTFPQSQLVVNKPGLLKAFFEARAMVSPAPAAGRLNLVAKKFISGVVLGEFQFQARKEGYKFLKAEVRGRTEKEQPVKVSASAGTDIKEVDISVIALQLDENGKLAWKGLESAEVELLNVGTRKTNKDGALIWKLADKGETVSINFYLVPDLEIKVTSLPKAYIAHPDASGKIYIFVGSKDGFEVTTDKDGNPIAQTKSPGDFVVADRRFKVSVVSGGGSLEGDIARPEQLDKTAHTIVYHPPQSLMEEVREVKLAIEDSEIPLYKAELTLKVFKNAFITVRKLGFREDVEPVPIDLVKVNGIKVVPGTVEGKVQENPQPDSGRPINGVTVTAHVADQKKETQTDGNVGPDAGRFTLRQLTENDATLRLQKPIVLPFLDFVEKFAHAFDGLRQLGYNAPHFREQEGFVDANNQPIFRYRWDLRYETDPAKLQRILNSIRRADAALKYTAEVEPMIKQYAKESLLGFVDLLLFAASELKLFDKLANMMSVGKGIGKGVKLSNAAKKHLRKKLQEAAQNNFTESDLKLIETLVDDALRNHGGLTDEAIESVKRNLRPGLSKLVGDTLKNYRDDISKNIELTIATLKSDIVGFIKGVLKKAGIKDTTPTGDPTKIGWWLDKAVDSTLNAVLSFFADKGFIPTPEAIFGFGDEIAEKVTNFLLNLANFKGNIQKTVDKGFKDLGSYNVSSAPEQTDKVVKEIAKMRENNEHWRRVYETSKTPLSSALAELKKMGVLEGSFVS